jgi:hypothetical protein
MLDNINMNTIKINKQLQTIKLNNKLYIPFNLNNLPTNYNKINIKYIFKLNSLIYIQSTQLNKNIIKLLNCSKLNKYSIN